MSAASDIAANRIVTLNFEGYRPDVYDDATSAPIMCRGQPTVGYGCRCRQWSPSFALKVLSLQLEEFEAPLLEEPWYVGCDEVRQSALLEIAFNQGDAGLESGYPLLIAAVADKDWSKAEVECTVSTPRLQSRYAVLGKVLFTGVSA